MARTILVIEDDPLSARLVSLMLGTEGYEVILAPDGLQALELAQDTLPDLVVLDLMMPQLDGYEVLRRLLTEPKTAGTPVVVVSARAQPADRQKAAQLGASAYLTKPYRRKDLLDVVHSLLDGSLEGAGEPSDR